MECPPRRGNTLKVKDGVFFSVNVGNWTFFDSVFKYIVCLGENKPTFNYLRYVATKNYKSVTLPQKTVR